MNIWLEYIFTPETLISIFSAVIVGVIAWTNLKVKVERNSKDIEEFKQLDLKVKIAEIQKDIQYMREKFDELISKK